MAIEVKSLHRLHEICHCLWYGIYLKLFLYCQKESQYFKTKLNRGDNMAIEKRTIVPFFLNECFNELHCFIVNDYDKDNNPIFDKNDEGEIEDYKYDYNPEPKLEQKLIKIIEDKDVNKSINVLIKDGTILKIV
jgi:hypothetical protein